MCCCLPWSCVMWQPGWVGWDEGHRPLCHVPSSSSSSSFAAGSRSIFSFLLARAELAGCAEHGGSPRLWAATVRGTSVKKQQEMGNFWAGVLVWFGGITWLGAAPAKVTVQARVRDGEAAACTSVPWRLLVLRSSACTQK